MDRGKSIQKSINDAPEPPASHQNIIAKSKTATNHIMRGQSSMVYIDRPSMQQSRYTFEFDVDTRRSQAEGWMRQVDEMVPNCPPGLEYLEGLDHVRSIII